MKTIIFVDQRRVEKYKTYCIIPQNMELIFLNKSLTDEEVLEKAGDAEFIFSDVIKEIRSHLIENMPNLRLIHSEGVGYNKIDIEAAKKAGVYVCNNPGVNKGAVAEQAILLMLVLLRKLIQGDERVRIGQQIQEKEEMILKGIKELADCKIGLIGLGDIGKETAKRLKAFDCDVYYYSRHRKDIDIEKKYGVTYMPLEELVITSDIISLHVPVTRETVGMVNQSFLHSMKNTGILINTARGELVDQEALRDALIFGEIAGAGLDTMTPEPVTLDNPLLALPEEKKYNLVLSPHTAGTTEGAFRKMHKGVWDNISRVIQNEKPIHIVNEE